MQYKKWEKGLLRPDGQPGFDTPTGKFEIASTILEEYGYDPLPVYTEPQEGPLARPDLAESYPLIFNSGARVVTDFRSQHHGIPGLLKERPEPTVTIHRLDAADRDIHDGDRVRVRTARGSVMLRARVTDDIVRGAVDANMGGGGPVGPDPWRNCNINDLTDLSHYDPISGFPVYKALLCEVEKIKKGGKRITVSSGEYEKTAQIDPPLTKDNHRIYLDHNATTPLSPKVRAAMETSLKTTFGNPSGIYREGKEARFAVESARRSVAKLLNCTARRILFTGCGSESNNLALRGVASAVRNGRNHLITSAIEHPSVLKTCRRLEKEGILVTYLPVDGTGRVDPDDLRRSISSKTFLVSIMTANNETGVLQPVRELARITREEGILFHTDAVQAAGKVAVDVEETGADLLSLSGHKFHGPKGIGVLYHRKDVALNPIITGGGQEQGLRAGTENLIGIVGLGSAAEEALIRLPEMERVSGLRDRLEEAILTLIPGAKVNGHRGKRVPNTLNVTLQGRVRRRHGTCCCLGTDTVVYDWRHGWN